LLELSKKRERDENEDDKNVVVSLIQNIIFTSVSRIETEKEKRKLEEITYGLGTG